MDDTRLTRLLRQLDAPAEPDPAFADDLFNRLRAEVARERRPVRPIRLLLLAAAIGGSLIAGGLAVGGGYIHLPQLAVVATESPSAPPSADQSPSPSALPTPTTSPSPSPLVLVSPTPGIAAEQAAARLTAYEQALAAHDYQAAWAMLAPSWRGTAATSYADYASERAAYEGSTRGEFTLGTPSNKQADIEIWLAPTVTAGVDVSRAWVIEVDYPRLAGNNAGYEIYILQPDAGGTWLIWPVR